MSAKVLPIVTCCREKHSAKFFGLSPPQRISRKTAQDHKGPQGHLIRSHSWTDLMHQRRWRHIIITCCTMIVIAQWLCGNAGCSANETLWSGLNIAPLTGTVVMDHISIITGALVRLTARLTTRTVYTDSFQNRQVQFEERTTEWSHHVSHLLSWWRPFVVLCSPLRCLVVPSLSSCSDSASVFLLS